MLWPFQRSTKNVPTPDPTPEDVKATFDELRRALRHARSLLREARGRAAAADKLAGVLTEQLARSERERTDAQLKLLRITCGINPFAEEMQQTSVLPAASAEPAAPVQISATASPDEVRATFVRRGMELYGKDLRKVARYVEKQQEEYYAHREAPQIVSPDELAAAAKVAADLEAALLEGAAAAAKE